MSTTRFETPRRPDPDGAAPIGSTPVSERSLAPDLARGMMLLLIALAHVPWFLYTSDIGTTSMHALDGGFADRVAQVLTIVIVDARTHTMFAFLFAYGVGQMYARQISRGAARRDVRRLLRTRHLWMLVFGGVHALLLWQGDIIGAYGMVGLIMVPLFLNRTDRTVKIWIGVLLVLGALLTLLSVVSAVVAPPHPSLEVEAADGLWKIELGNPRQTERAGFDDTSAKPGDEVVVLGNRSLDKAEKRMKAVRITVAGKAYDIYPERIETN